MKKLNLLLCMSAMIATGAYADFTPKYATFEEGNTEGAIGNWIGDSEITDGASVATAGLPGGSQDPGTNLKVLSVTGTVSNGTMFAGMVSGTKTQIDLLVKVAKPDEPLALPDEDEGKVKIAVGIDTNGALNVYCVGTNGLAFYPVSTNLVEDAWVRVSLEFKDARCQVLLNSNLCKNPNGYKDSTDGSSGEGGAWYQLPEGKNNSTAVAALKIVGTTAIDDVYTAQNSEGISIDDSVTTTGTVGGNTVTVENSWLYKNQVNADEFSSTATDGTMTVGEKYVFGLDVDDGKKIELVDMQPVADNANKMKFVIPGTGAKAGSGYSFKLTSCATPNGEYTDAGATIDGNTATLDISTFMNGDVKVKYFKAEMVAPAP